MKYLLIIVTLTLLATESRAQKASEFLNAQISTFFDLHKASEEFNQKLLDIKGVDEAKKSIDDYSIQVETSIAVFGKFKKSPDSQIAEVSTDLAKLLSDILNNNYSLLGRLVKPDYSADNLKSDCKALVNKNQFASNFFRDISLGVCMTLTREKPKKSKKTEQFSKLTELQRDEANNLLITKYGETIKQGKKIESKTPFEFSARMIYEFINMDWVFDEKK